VKDCREHIWTMIDDRRWACEQCEAESATCETCHGPSGTSLLVCEPCLRHAAKVLDDIDAALSHYESAAGSLVKSPGDMRLIPGFGSAGGGIAGPEDVIGQLWSWVARWSEYTGASNQDAIAYLKGHHMWAAHNVEVSDWPVYLRAMRTLRHQARRIAGLLPQRLNEPCVYCGGQAVQDWADDHWEPLREGLSDTVRCTRCGMTWHDSVLWRKVTREHIVELPKEHADSLVTLDQARMIWPEIPAATWRSWLKRDRDQWAESVGEAQIWHQAWCEYEAEPGPSMERDEPPSLVERTLPERGEKNGAALYRVGDLHAMVARRTDESRPGRPVESEKIGA